MLCRPARQMFEQHINSFMKWSIIGWLMFAMVVS